MIMSMADKAKVVVAGDAGGLYFQCFPDVLKKCTVLVGKTALLSKFLFNIFVQDYNFTVGIDFHSKFVKLKNGDSCRLQLWDTAGQERFRALLPSYLRDCCAVLLIYDVTSLSFFSIFKYPKFPIEDRKSFDGIPFWIDYVKRHTTKQPSIILVGMKIDLSNERLVFICFSIFARTALSVVVI